MEDVLTCTSETFSRTRFGTVCLFANLPRLSSAVMKMEQTRPPVSSAARPPGQERADVTSAVLVNEYSMHFIWRGKSLSQHRMLFCRALNHMLSSVGTSSVPSSITKLFCRAACWLTGFYIQAWRIYGEAALLPLKPPLPHSLLAPFISLSAWQLFTSFTRRSAFQTQWSTWVNRWSTLAEM